MFSIYKIDEANSTHFADGGLFFLPFFTLPRAEAQKSFAKMKFTKALTRPSPKFQHLVPLSNYLLFFSFNLYFIFVIWPIPSAVHAARY
jgi:hypothetical protein